MPARDAIPHEGGRPLLTKIIATIGPASESPGVVRGLIEAGVSVFRLNFSHGTLEDHARRLTVIRDIARELGRPIAVMGDLQGPKIRVGRTPSGGLELAPGTDVVLRRGLAEARFEEVGGSRVAALPFEYEPLVREVRPGHRVLINDGLVRMLAVDRDEARGELRCRVLVGGLVTSAKGINLPDSEVSAPALGDRDWACVEWAVRHGLDFLAMSFVRRASEVLALKARLAGMCPIDRRESEDHGAGSAIPVIAKIERPQALRELREIVEASDAVMVARGDLGVEMDIARVPIVQKAIVRECAEVGRPCIVATQMLESMIEQASPTRAEATDVANAVFDGAGCVMLSAETASGKRPVLAVETMRRIAQAAEEHLASLPRSPSPPPRPERARTAALAHGAWHMAMDTGAQLVVCWSQSGGAARYLSENAFPIPIIAYSSSEKAVRRMALLRGVTGVLANPPASMRLSDWNAQVDRDLVSRGWARQGTPIVLLAGKPLGMPRVMTMVAIHRVGERSGFIGQDA